jgi:regulator of replication initiation timing
MQQIAAKIFEISLKAERMDRFVRLLLQEQAKMEEQMDILQSENTQLLFDNKQLKEKKGEVDTEKWAKMEQEMAFLQSENQKLMAENETLRNTQMADVALRAVDIEAQDAMKIKIETYIKEIDACLKIFGD